jgi:hypothetical protein
MGKPMKNRAGVPVSLGDGKYSNTFYCSRVLGFDIIIGSDGQCGPGNGPQCPDCKASFPSQVEHNEEDEEYDDEDDDEGTRYFNYMPVDLETGRVEPGTSLVCLIKLLLGKTPTFHRENYPKFTKGIMDAISKILRKKLGEKSIEVNSSDILFIHETYHYLHLTKQDMYYVIQTNFGKVLVTEDQNVSLYYGKCSPFEKTGELKAGTKWYHVFMWLCNLNYSWSGKNAETGDYFVSDNSAKIVKEYLSKMLRKMFSNKCNYTIETFGAEQLDGNGNPRIATKINGVDKFLIFHQTEGIDVSIEIQDVPEGHQNEFSANVANSFLNLMKEQFPELKPELDSDSEEEEQKTGEKAGEQKEICEPRAKGPTCFNCKSTYRCRLDNSCCDECSNKIVFINTQDLFEACKSDWDSIHQNYIDALKSRFGIVKSQLSCFKKTAAGLFVFCEMEERFKIKAIHYISSSGEHVKCASNSLSMM